MTDTLDLLTPEEAAAALSRQGGASPVTLQADAMAHLVTAVSRSIDAKCGPVVQRTITGELHDGSDRRGCRHPEILLRKITGGDSPPVISITTVTEYAGTAATVLTAETNASKPTDSYLLDDSGYLHRRAGGNESAFPDGSKNVAVTYEAGRYADTAAVDELFKSAATMLFAHLWSGQHGVGSRFGDPENSLGVTATGIPTFAWPRAVQDQLLGELLVPGIG